MVDITAAQVFRDFETDGVPASGAHNPRKTDIRRWGSQIEAVIQAFLTNGGLIYPTRSFLEADLSQDANSMAWVIGDPSPSNNGVYGKVGPAGSGTWVRRADLPYSFIFASNLGAGDPSSIQATTSIPVSSSALILLEIAENYVGTSATVSFNDGNPLTIKANSGEDVQSLVGGSVVYGVISGGNFRLANDESIAALIYAARDASIEARAGSEAARDLAESYASDAVSQGNVPIYASVASMPGILVPVGINALRVNGYNSAGDGGGALYLRTGSEPSHAGKFQSSGGVWWELAVVTPNILMFGARAGSASYAVANLAAINAAIAYKSAKGGGKVLGAAGIFYVSGKILHQGSAGVDFDGLQKSMTLKATSGFTDTEIVSIRGTKNILTDVIIDCSAIMTAGVWVSGVRVENGNSVDCGVRGCEIKDASFCGLWMNDSNGTYTHLRFFAENNIVANVGWMAISFCGTINGRIEKNNVSRTGFTAIWAENRNVGLRIVDNDVTKATPPYRIYDGPGAVGGVEKGFIIGYAPSNKDTLIADNRCIDNRNAAEDGIGLGEDGTEHGPAIIRNNFVQYAGLFGIDVASRATVQGNRIEEPAQSGIFMSLDLGGSIAQAIVKDNTIRSCNGPYAIQVSQNMGNPLTIADCEISGNIIVDYRATPSTQYGIRVRRNDLTITNLKICDNIAINIGGAGAGFLNDGTGQDWPITVSRNKWRNQSKAVSGNFSTTGYEEFTVSNASPIDFTLMTGGYEGKEVTLYFNDGNTTLKPDWTNSLNNGANRIIGLGNVARLMAAGDAAKLRYRSGLGWQITAIVDSF
ncbi:right-handed parallel beta-helix repeat-containing protein [Agrobacterium pusense]|uniref:right-handed parallel beta-helix repeat-containing protein n=1 Tax=Agrobacterium pusense TaxID=648995 RepID=UPI0024489B93|nr:right-handed parallel beta-helix repeat-containing protein [Agrobacterium pusense]MDH0873670.1 right-handed parallel beta-helix repeat-containing protein [Agrobacterium pusense]